MDTDLLLAEYCKQRTHTVSHHGEHNISKSHGIFHGLPVYPERFKELTALVVGASGISGYHMVRVLSAAPERWHKIYALMRRPLPDYFLKELGDGASRVKHIMCDLMKSPEEIAKSLADAHDINFVFFFSYMGTSSSGEVGSQFAEAEKLTQLNGSLLRNLIRGLQIAEIKPKSFPLQTRAKHYACHLGPRYVPSYEEDSRVNAEENLYYAQEDILFDYTRQEDVDWIVTRPSIIVGAVRDNALNFLPGLAAYAAINSHLGRPLAFPGDLTSWDRECCQSSAWLDAYFQEWAILNSSREALNITDGGPFTWGRLWQHLATWYRLECGYPEIDDSKFEIMSIDTKLRLRDYGPLPSTRYSFSFVWWAKDPTVEQAWKALKSKHDLQLDAFEDITKTFGPCDTAVLGGWPLSMSTSKTRKHGFFGTVDSYESVFHAIRDLTRMKAAVPMLHDQFTHNVI